MEYGAIFKPIGSKEATIRDTNLYEGVGESIQKIKKKYRFGVVSSQDKSWVWDAIKLHGVYDFSVYFNGKEKPLPKSIEKQLLEGARNLGVQPSEISCICAKAETVEEAKKAGVNAIAAVYAGRSTIEELKKANPDKIVNSIGEISQLLGI